MFSKAWNRVFTARPKFRLSTGAQMRKLLSKIPMKETYNRAISAEKQLFKERKASRDNWEDPKVGAVQGALNCVTRVKNLSLHSGDTSAQKLLEAAKKEDQTEAGLLKCRAVHRG
jgi:hypothetical protein